MTCTFTLSGLTPVMAGLLLDRIDFEGAIDFGGGTPCANLGIEVRCNNVLVVGPTLVPISTSGTSGTFSASLTNLPATMTSCCGHNLTVMVTCPGCGYQTFVLPLNCGKKCPDLGNITCTVGPCQFDGTVQLTGNAQLTSLNVYPSADVQWEVDNTPVSSQVTMTAPGAVPAGVVTLPAAGQTVNLQLNIVNPGICPSIGMAVKLPNCGTGCSPIKIESTVGDCNAQGMRPVTITALLTGGTATTQINATMTSPCGTAPVTGSGTGSLTLTSSCDLSPGTYTVTVTAAGCPDQNYTFKVPDCCPTITISHSSGDCNSDDTRTVTITAVLTASPATPISATMTGPCGPVSQSGTGSVTLTSSCALSAGNYSVEVIAAGCPPQTYSFTVAQCCPKIDIGHKVGHCHPDGTRPVTILAVLTTGSASTAIDATMTSPCNSVSQTGTGTVTLADVCDLNTGTYTVEVTAKGCPPQTYTFSVQDCCPGVDFEVVVKGLPICDNNNNLRPVVIKATVTPYNGVPTTATLTDSATGSVMATGSGSTQFVLTGNRSYGEGSHQVEVSFAAPLKCPPRTFQVCIPKCETFACFVLRTQIAVGFTIFFAIACMNGTAALASYMTTTPAWLLGRWHDYQTLSGAVGPVMVAAIIAAVVLLIWWWLCIKIWHWHIGACCYGSCLLRLLLWQVPLMVGMCLLWFLATCWSLNLVSAIVLFLVSYLFYRWWAKKCCPGTCDAWFYLSCAMTVVGLAATSIDIVHVTTVAVNDNTGTLSWYVSWYRTNLWILTSIIRLGMGVVIFLVGVWVLICVTKANKA